MDADQWLTRQAPLVDDFSLDTDWLSAGHHHHLFPRHLGTIKKPVLGHVGEDAEVHVSFQDRFGQT